MSKQPTKEDVARLEAEKKARYAMYMKLREQRKNQLTPI